MLSNANLITLITFKGLLSWKVLIIVRQRKNQTNKGYHGVCVFIQLFRGHFLFVLLKKILQEILQEELLALIIIN